MCLQKKKFHYKFQIGFIQWQGCIYICQCHCFAEKISSDQYVSSFLVPYLLVHHKGENPLNYYTHPSRSSRKTWMLGIAHPMGAQ